MKPECSSPCSQKPATGASLLDSLDSTPFLSDIHFNNILPCCFLTKFLVSAYVSYFQHRAICPAHFTSFHLTSLKCYVKGTNHESFNYGIFPVVLLFIS
jgi:hypothetical protein